MPTSKAENILSKIYIFVKNNYGELIGKDKNEVKRSLAKELGDKDFSIMSSVLENHLDHIYKRIIDGMKENGYRSIYRYTIETVSNFTIDRGIGPLRIVFEIGLAIHPIYGIPYIPSSALKGAFNHTALRYAEFLDSKLNIDAGKSKGVFTSIVEWVLGHDGSGISHIMFSDAFPEFSGRLLSPDVITPHYTDKIENELRVKPNPLIHIVVSKGVKFRFYMGISHRRFERIENVLVVRGLGNLKSELDREERLRRYIKLGGEKEIAFRLEEFSRDVIHLMLELGVGAKTNVGYSRFRIVEETSV